METLPPGVESRVVEVATSPLTGSDGSFFVENVVAIWACPDADRARRFHAGEHERPERTLPRTNSDGEMEDTSDLAARKLLRR
jgi:hypothetical protein